MVTNSLEQDVIKTDGSAPSDTNRKTRRYRTRFSGTGLDGRPTTQKPVGVSPCQFDSDLRHHSLFLLVFRDYSSEITGPRTEIADILPTFFQLCLSHNPGESVCGLLLPSGKQVTVNVPRRTHTGVPEPFCYEQNTLAVLQ